MIKFRFKVYLAIFFASIVGATFFYLNHATQRLLAFHSEIVHQLTDIDLYNEQINKQILNSAFRLYDTNDKTNLLIQKLRSRIEAVSENPVFQDKAYQEVTNKFQQFKQALDHKEKAIQKFATLNAMIKNSATYVPSLSTRYLQRFGHQDKEYLLELSKITSAIFLAHNAMDADLLGTIKESMEFLQSKKFDDKDKTSFNQVFLSHAKVMNRYLPIYQPVFNEIVSNTSSQLLHQTEAEFTAISTVQANRLSTLWYSVMLAFLTSVILIVYLLFHVEKSRQQQIQLHQELKIRATTDSLTTLDNRFAFEQVEQNLNESWSLLLINIDGFKHINDFYGRQIGDRVLKHISAVIKTFLFQTGQQHIYRVGADDFAVLVEQNNEKKLSLLVQDIIQSIESEGFTYQEINLLLQVSIGISNVPPLLETADLALRQVKNTRKKYQLYSSEQALEKQVKANLNMMQFIRKSIEHDYIVPHFMPLMRNTDNQVVAFECLIRLQDTEGKLYFPDEFLPVAKKGRLYGKLTQIMFDKCLTTFEGTEYLFSINLSIEDIDDNEVTNFIIKRLQQSPEVGRRLTLEILESEGVKNYDQLQKFVKKIKLFGCRIAIDDYGTGYSNLQHLVKLKADNLKLDGSLIEPMVTDENSTVAVSAIVDMAKDLEISSTTAEYVSSKEVLKIVKSLNISYSQGFYIGKASPELRTIPEFLAHN